jgi:subtilase family serine protease
VNRRRSFVARLAGAFVLSSLLLATVGTSVDASSPLRVAGTKPGWATSTALVGHASPTQTVGFRLYLGWRNANAATALAKAVSDPNSSSYRQFLSPAQFRSRFAPTASDVASVQNWLKASGF